MDHATLTLLITYKYWIIIPLAFFEGPMIAIMVGFLASLGYFAVIPLYLLLFLWDFARDLFFYHVGKVANHKDFLQKYGAKINLDERHFSIVSSLWYKHTNKTMLLGKLAFGLSSIILMTAGAVRLPIRRFAKSAFVISMVQYALFIFAGFYFGKFYVVLSEYVDYAGYAVATLAIIFIASYIFFAKRAKSTFIHSIDKSMPATT